MENLNNPLSFPTIPSLLTALLNVVMVISIPILVFFIIYAGFLYVTARGNVEQLQQASRALLYAVIGAVVILGSVAITAIVENTVNAF